MIEAELQNYDELLALAEKWHDGQMRWEREPYIEHPKRIARRTIAITGSGYYANVALVHDLFEDTEVNRDDVLELLTPDERYALFLLTRGEETYNQYLNRILESDSHLAIFVKMCDALDNSWLQKADCDYIRNVLKKDPIKNYRDRYLGIAAKCKDRLVELRWSESYLDIVLKMYTLSLEVRPFVLERHRRIDLYRNGACPVRIGPFYKPNKV